MKLLLVGTRCTFAKCTTIIIVELAVTSDIGFFLDYMVGCGMVWLWFWFSYVELCDL
jgi:hypothetical protein